MTNKIAISRGKNIILGIVILGILGPALLFSFPQKTEAAVPVFETGLLKEGPLDFFAYSASKFVLRNLIIKPIINWIARGGFDGRPLFVEDFKYYLLESGDRGTAIYLRELNAGSGQIAGPFRGTILTLFNNSTQNTFPHAKSTIENIVNPRAFYNDYSVGGSEAFLVSILNPNNNFLGIHLLEQERLARQQAIEIESSRIETESSGGFIGYKECLEYTDFGSGPLCIKFGPIKTPASNAQGLLNRVSESDINTLEAADELNELLDKLFDGQLISNRLFFGITDFDSSSLDNPPNDIAFPEPPATTTSPVETPSSISGPVTVTSACESGVSVNIMSWTPLTIIGTPTYNVRYCTGTNCTVILFSPTVPGCSDINEIACKHFGVIPGKIYGYRVFAPSGALNDSVNYITAQSCS